MPTYDLGWSRFTFENQPPRLVRKRRYQARAAALPRTVPAAIVTWSAPSRSATRRARAITSGFSQQSASVKRIQSPVAAFAPMWQAWHLPSQPVRQHVHALQQEPCVVFSPTAGEFRPYDPLNDHSTTMISNSTPRCRSKWRTVCSIRASSSRAAMTTEHLARLSVAAKMSSARQPPHPAQLLEKGDSHRQKTAPSSRRR